MAWIVCVCCEKFQHDLVARTCALISQVRPRLHRSSCNNETVRNTPKYEFGVQWGVSRTFVAKKSDASDKDITSMDMTILVPSCPKVNQLYFKIKFDTFEQLMLHYNFCAFLFSELLDWTKPCVEITWKTWRTKEIDWGPCPNLPNILHQATTSLLVQGKKKSKSNTFWMLDSDCRKEPSCNNYHDFIRTPIRGYLDFTKSL
jgi:hypothetical protein